MTSTVKIGKRACGANWPMVLTIWSTDQDAVDVTARVEQAPLSNTGLARTVTIRLSAEVANALTVALTQTNTNRKTPPSRPRCWHW
jgi:hypothetical protein